MSEDIDLFLLEDAKLTDLYNVQGYLASLKDISRVCPETSDLQTMVFEIALQCVEKEIAMREEGE